MLRRWANAAPATNTNRILKDRPATTRTSIGAEPAWLWMMLVGYYCIVLKLVDSFLIYPQGNKLPVFLILQY
jgi:hypothetical protein